MPLQIGFVLSCCVSTLPMFILYGRGHGLLGLPCFLLSILWFCFCFFFFFFLYVFSVTGLVSFLHSFPVMFVISFGLVFLSFMQFLLLTLSTVPYFFLSCFCYRFEFCCWSVFYCRSLSLFPMHFSLSPGVSLGFCFFSVFFESFLLFGLLGGPLDLTFYWAFPFMGFWVSIGKNKHQQHFWLCHYFYLYSIYIYIYMFYDKNFL